MFQIELVFKARLQLRVQRMRREAQSNKDKNFTSNKISDYQIPIENLRSSD